MAFCFITALLRRKKDVFLYDERPYHIVDRSKISRNSVQLFNEDTLGPDWLQSVQNHQDDAPQQHSSRTSQENRSSTGGIGGAGTSFGKFYLESELLPGLQDIRKTRSGSVDSTFLEEEVRDYNDNNDPRVLDETDQIGKIHPLSLKFSALQIL